MTLKNQIKKARAAYMRLRKRSNLRRYLALKSRAGIFDKRIFAYYDVDYKVNKPCRKAAMRGYVAGLVPTSTTGGAHSATSYHSQKNAKGEGKAIDLGLRKSEVGTPKGADKLAVFQRQELWRFEHGRFPHMKELLGPTNNRMVLRGKRTSLAEGTALENQHDNHVHEAHDA